MELIDKAAVVAEIKRRKEESWLGSYTKEKGIIFDITNEILSFLDTLEVKEVDLEKELNDYGYHYDYVSLADRKELVDFAKHFFELGMQVSNKAQKGEKV